MARCSSGTLCHRVTEDKNTDLLSASGITAAFRERLISQHVNHRYLVRAKSSPKYPTPTFHMYLSKCGFVKKQSDMVDSDLHIRLLYVDEAI